MSALSKDELGFVRARSYGRTNKAELNALLNAGSDEEIYVSSVENGVRKSKVLGKASVINTKSGDTFSVGPRVTKAAFFDDLFGQQRVTGTAPEIPGICGTRRWDGATTWFQQSCNRSNTDWH